MYFETSQVGEDEEPFTLPCEFVMVPLLHIVFGSRHEFGKDGVFRRSMFDDTFEEPNRTFICKLGRGQRVVRMIGNDRGDGPYSTVDKSSQSYM